MEVGSQMLTADLGPERRDRTGETVGMRIVQE